MTWRKAALLLALLLTACERPATRYAIDVARLDAVIHRIKEEVGAYISEFNRREADRRVHPPASTECGTGRLDFRLTEVAIDLTVTQATSVSGGVGASVPIASAGTLGLDISAGRTTTNSQVLHFGSVILPNATYTQAEGVANDPNRYQLYAALSALQQALIRGSRRPPCFNAMRSGEPFPNTFKIGFKVDDDEKGGIKLTLVVATVSAEAKQTNTAENYITVTFTPTDEPAPAARPGRAPGPPLGTWRLPEDRRRGGWMYVPPTGAFM